MASIKFKTTATVSNVNVRLEGSKSEGTQVPALDLKMAATVPGNVLASLLGCDVDQAQIFWLQSTDGRIPAFPHLGEIRSHATFENCNVKIGPRKFRAVKLRGVVATAADEHYLEIVFTLSLAGMSDAASGFLCSLFHESIALEVESAQVDAFDDNGGDGDE